jgi:hypothetical protein
VCNRDIPFFLSREREGVLDRSVSSGLLMLLLRLCFEMLAAATIGPCGILSSCWFYLAIFPLTKDQ